MKLFGGGSPHHSNHPKRQAEPAPRRHVPRDADFPEYSDTDYETAPKPANHKPPLTKRQKHNRILLVIVSVTLAIIMGMCAAAAVMMKPPKLAEDSGKPVATVRPERNDSTMKDPENGDEMDLDGGEAIDDIDMGNRRKGVYTVLVAATDIDGTRTDALMVATLDTVNDTVNVMNIPRDLMSSCNRTGDSKKINAAYGTRGGIDTTKSDVKKVIGFTPDKYVVISFNGIAEVIDALGGVTYEVPWRMKYDDPTQNLHIDFQPGETKMDGQAAVEFMRWRKNNSGVSTGVKGTTGGDEERIEKDQKFLKFLAKEVFQVKNVPRIPGLAQAVFKNVETDLTAGEVLWLAWRLYDVKNENINMMTLPGYGQMSYAGTGQMYSFYFPYRSQTLEMVNEYLNPYEKPITNIDVVSGPSKGSGKSKKDTKPKDEEASAKDEETGDPESGESGTGGAENAGGTTVDPETGEGTGAGTEGSSTESSGSGTEGGTVDPEGGSADGNEQGGETAAPEAPVTEPLEPVMPIDPIISESLFGPAATADPETGA